MLMLGPPARDVRLLLPVVPGARTGTNGVSTNGVTAFFSCFDRGTFWVLPLAYFYLPKSARAYLFPQSVRIIQKFSPPICQNPMKELTRLSAAKAYALDLLPSALLAVLPVILLIILISIIISKLLLIIILLVM